VESVYRLIEEVEAQNTVVVLRRSICQPGTEPFHIFNNHFFFDLRPAGIVQAEFNNKGVSNFKARHHL